MTYPPHPYLLRSEPEEPKTQRTDRRRILQLLAGVVLFILTSVVLLTVDWALLNLSGRPIEITDPGTIARPGWIAVISACAAAAVALLLYRLIVGWIGGDPGQGLRGGSKTIEFLFGITVGVAVILAAIGIIALLGGYRITGIQLSDGILIGLAGGISAGVIEEIVFRGILLRILDAWFGSWAALIISSALFGAAHLGNPGSSWWGATAIAVEAGLLLGGAYLLTRRLWLPIGIHATWNFLSGGIFSSPISGVGSGDGLFAATFSGPDWLTGGDLGMEGSVITVAVCSLAGLAMLFLAHRQGQLLPSVRTERRRAANPQR